MINLSSKIFYFFFYFLIYIIYIHATRIYDPTGHENLHPRYANKTILNDTVSKNYPLLVFLSITAGKSMNLREAIRNTWILPCALSPDCDYRFFVDVPESLMTPELRNESQIYSDIVFRNECSLMTRHPDILNYGNALPYYKYAEQSNTAIAHKEIDYKLRLAYKIDWKVCFLRWINKHTNDSVKHHVFVEDDSFVCTEHLLFQLRQVSKQEIIRNTTLRYRTGTYMHDGFDDSSTMMDNSIARIFVDNYPTAGFNCSMTIDSTDNNTLYSKSYLSWGNSWISSACGWRNLVEEKLGSKIIKPNLDCFSAKSDYHHLNPTSVKISLECTRFSIIFHHTLAGEIFLKEAPRRLPHMCENLLLIDKIKAPHFLYSMWNKGSVRNNFYDFSDLFFYENITGWINTLTHLENEEKQCVKVKESYNSSRIDHHYPCLFEENTRRRLTPWTYSLLQDGLSYKSFFNLEKIEQDYEKSNRKILT